MLSKSKENFRIKGEENNSCSWFTFFFFLLQRKVNEQHKLMMTDTRNLDKKQDHSELPACFDELNRGISADEMPDQSWGLLKFSITWKTLLQFYIINKNETISCKEILHKELLLYMEENLVSFSGCNHQVLVLVCHLKQKSAFALFLLLKHQTLHFSSRS